MYGVWEPGIWKSLRNSGTSYKDPWSFSINPGTPQPLQEFRKFWKDPRLRNHFFRKRRVILGTISGNISRTSTTTPSVLPEEPSSAFGSRAGVQFSGQFVLKYVFNELTRLWAPGPPKFFFFWENKNNRVELMGLNRGQWWGSTRPCWIRRKSDGIKDV